MCALTVVASTWARTRGCMLSIASMTWLALSVQVLLCGLRWWQLGVDLGRCSSDTLGGRKLRMWLTREGLRSKGWLRCSSVGGLGSAGGSSCKKLGLLKAVVAWL